MATKYNINRELMAQTKQYLTAHRLNHVGSVTPLIDAVKELGELSDFDKSRYFRAAKQLGYSVMQSNGVYYERGVRIW